MKKLETLMHTMEDVPDSILDEVLDFAEYLKVKKFNDDWDKQIEQDALDGKLDKLVEKAQRDYDEGKCTEL